MTFDQLIITNHEDPQPAITTLAISSSREIQPDVLVFTGNNSEATCLAASEYAAKHAVEHLQERHPDSDDAKELAELYSAGKYDEVITRAEDNHDLYYGFGPQRINLVTYEAAAAE